MNTLDCALIDFNTLPDEMLIYVASFLHECCAFAHVCRRFHGVAHDVFNQEPVFWHACRCGYTEIVKQLLVDARVDPAADNNYAIRCSSMNVHPDVVRLLLEDDRTDPTADDNWPILLSSYRGHTDVVRLLLADGRADPTAGNNHAIRVSSYCGHAEVAKLLLEDGRADPTACSPDTL